MKLPLTFIAFIVCFFSAKAQNANCSKFREGKFKTTINGITDTVYRKGLHQYEIGVKGKDTIKVGFIVKWIDDCTYTLRPDSEDFKKYPKLPRTALLTVKMSDAKENSYVQTTSINYSDKIFTSEMILLPNN